MRKRKELNYDNLNIYVMYNDLDTSMEFINKVNSRRLICFSFDPNELITEAKAKEIMDNYETQMLSEAKKIVEDNKSFYKNFDIEFRFSGGGCTLFRVANKLFVSRMEKIIEICPK